MESSPAAVGGRRRSLRTLRANPERLAECGHDLMHVDLASDRDLKCDICWRNRETLILRLLEPFERALKVEPEELQKILAQEQQERERKAEEDRRMREKREDERRRKEEESKRKRERMRAMQEARRGKGGKFEKKPKVDHRPSGSETSSTVGGKRRGENGKFVKAGSADQSSEGSMSMERDMEATPEVMGWGESSWSPEVMEAKFTSRQATPAEWERNTQSSAVASTAAAAAATDTESVDNTARSPVYGRNGEAGYVKQEPDTAMEGYPSVAVDAKPIEPILAEPLPCQQRQRHDGESHTRAAPLTAVTAQPEIIPKEEVMEDVSLDLTAPPASAQFEVAPGPTIDASPHPPPIRLQSPSRASSIADVATAPSAPPLALPPPPTAHPIEASVRVQPPSQTASDGRATRHRSSSSTRSACKPVVPTTKMKAKAKPQGRRASDTSTVSPPAPPAPVQPLRFIHTSAPPSQPLHQSTILSFFPVSGSGAAAPTPPPIFTAGGNAGFPAVASSPAAGATAQRDRELKRSLRGRETVRLRDEDPNRRKSQRSSAAIGRINYCESSDEDDDDDDDEGAL